jgi:uncharacterized protein YbjT (DUF2867 family)
VRQATDREWGVKLLSRAPEGMPEEPGVQVVGGGVLDPGAVYRTATDCNAVLLLLSLTKNNPPDMLSEGTEIITQVMQKLGISRIVAVTSIGIGESAEQGSILFKLASRTVRRRHIAAKSQQEAVLRKSGLEWTIVRPAFLTDDPGTGQARAGTDTATVVGSVSREDLASFVLSEIADRNFVHKAPYIT